MPEHPKRRRGRRGLALALVVPAAAVGAILTATSMATGATGTPAAQDETTSLFMQEFYRHLLAGEGRGASLRQAMSSVRRGHDHPHFGSYWLTHTWTFM